MAVAITAERGHTSCSQAGQGSTLRRMARVTIYHNPNCSSSRHAVEVAAELGTDVEVIQYLKHPLDAAAIRSIAAKLDVPVTELVRRDALWTKLGLTDADVQTLDQVVEVLVAHPALLQRPLIVTADAAVIGRPKDRSREVLAPRS
jgi:arsenate reductase